MTTKSMSRGMVVLTAVLLTTGCEPQPQPREEQPQQEPEIAVIEPAPQEDETTFDEPEPAEFAGAWPGEADYDTFDLTWLGGDEHLELYEQPNYDSEVIGTISGYDGEKFDWLGTSIHVEQPREYRANEDFELPVTLYDTEDNELHLEEESYQVELGDPVHAYHRVGEGGCYLGVNGEVMLADCPEGKVDRVEESQDRLVEPPWTAELAHWWIKVESDNGTGWVELDDGLLQVHPRQLETYDDLETSPEERPGKEFID